MLSCSQLLEQAAEMPQQSTPKAHAKSQSPELRRIIALLDGADGSTLRRVAIVVKAMLA